MTLHTFMAGELIETSAAPPPRDDSEAAGDARPTKDAEDRRVRQFVRGEAGERLDEMTRTSTQPSSNGT